MFHGCCGFQSSQMTFFFALARQAFVPAYRSHIVGFACYFGRACVQMSGLELQHFGCGCGFFFFITIERGRHVCESHSLEWSSDLFCCTARMTNDVQTIIAGTSHHDMVYFCELSRPSACVSTSVHKIRCSKDARKESHFDSVSGSTESWHCHP